MLDENIYLAEPIEQSQVLPDGSLLASAARLSLRTPWDVEVAAQFALYCVESSLGSPSLTGDMTLSDGTSLRAVLAEAHKVLATRSAEDF